MKNPIKQCVIITKNRKTEQFFLHFHKLTLYKVFMGQQEVHNCIVQYFYFSTNVNTNNFHIN